VKMYAHQFIGKSFVAKTRYIAGPCDIFMLV
jgi:hypothetical protein